MKQLPRQPLRPQPDPIWRPTWRCYCCHDTGYISRGLVQLVIPDYQPNDDKQPICQNPGCTAANRFDESWYPSFDFRFDATICQELDRNERQGWEETICYKKERLAKNSQPSDSVRQQSPPKFSQISLSEFPPNLSDCVKSLRSQPRTPEEEALAQQKHQQARSRG